MRHYYLLIMFLDPPNILYEVGRERCNYPQNTDERLRLREIRVVLECAAN